MQVIISHVNINFDGFASMYAAKRMFPNAVMVLPETQHPMVKQYLLIYRDNFKFSHIKEINWQTINELILVNVSNLKQAGLLGLVPEHVQITLYNHQPPRKRDVCTSMVRVEEVCANITILLEEIRARGLTISAFEATLFGLGLYTETGSFINSRTTTRDLNIACFLLQSGMDLELVHCFSREIASNQQQLIKQQRPIVKLPITAKLFMSSPVKTLFTNLTINEAAKKILQYGHSGFPVIDKNNQLTGMISRRDIDKAVHLKLGHAPVATFMSEDPITLPQTVGLEEIQQTMIWHNIGRIPIVENDQLVGIISRTDIIEVLHNKNHKLKGAVSVQKANILELLQNLVNPKTFTLLQQIGHESDQQNIKAFLVGGFVRDLLLKRSSEDIDIVIEGDGIAFAYHLAHVLGGSVKEHSQFGTATWTTTDDEKLDIVSCRTEYYSVPAALPTVRPSNIREDISRRDFTINAMAVSLNREEFGILLDIFNGNKDLARKKIRILHNLSFVEDPTRIFRAARFAARFGYDLTEQTTRLAKISLFALNDLSKTRIIHEFELIFSEATFSKTISILSKLGIWKYLLNHSPNEQQFKQFEKLTTFNFTNTNKFDWFIFLTSLVYGHWNWVNLMSTYALKSAHKQFLNEVKNASTFFHISSLSFATIHLEMKNVSNQALLFYSLCSSEKNEAVIQEYLNRRSKLKPLLTGHDLKRLGLVQGPLYSECLSQLECVMLDGKINTKEEAEVWVLKHFPINQA